MKVRLLQLDGKMPNIALMKISTYHKRKGDDVGWYQPLSDLLDTDILYVSKLFDFTPDYNYYPINCKIEKGGTGFDIYKTLPYNIEIITELDYSLYPTCNYSMQFYSRGCNNHCEFCVVPDKEGAIISTIPYELNPNGEWIEVLDNNFFQAPRWEQAVEHLLKIGQKVNFHGVELDTIGFKEAEALNKLKHKKAIHIAWDHPKERPQEKIREVLQWIKPYKIMCYVLIGFNSTEEEDYYRAIELKKLNIMPFIMPFNKEDQYQKDFARWGNHKAIFKTVDWYDYDCITNRNRRKI